ncbi:unnamed protein product [Rhizophagus irregularis]|nr:unnamed protein product [Rhizophagus irregularis]CAB5337546.1 unnamed protein product [Rhizophagus irregularis]
MILTEIDKKTSIATNYTTSSRLFTSKVYKFENLPEPRNGIEEEQEVLLSKPCNFSIPNNIDDFKKSVYFKPSNKKISKLSNILEGSKKLSVIFNKFK